MTKTAIQEHRRNKRYDSNHRKDSNDTNPFASLSRGSKKLQEVGYGSRFMKMPASEPEKEIVKQ